jgi:Secretion system C-terminal sorting domain
MKKKITLLLLVIVFTLNASAQWMRKYSLYYQPSGLLIDSAAYYNNGLMNDSIIDYAPAGGNQMVFSYRQVFEYDSYGNNISRTNSIFNTTWSLYNRVLMTYDSAQQLAETIYQLYENNAWLNTIKIDYSYDSNGFLTLEQSSVWNGSAWETYWKQEHTNDDVGHVSSIEFEYEESNWQQSATHTYTYMNGLLIQDLELDELGEPLNKMEYTYDTDERVVYFRNSEWNVDAADWVYYDRYFTYNEFGNLVNELAGYQIYTGKSIDYYAGTSVEHVYEFVTIVLEQEAQSMLVVSPNPAADYFNINVLENQSTLHIYDGQGRVVDKLNLAMGNQKVDIENYTSGVYYLTLQNSKGWFSARLQVR